MTPLHKLYTLSGWLSGVFLVSICVLVVAQIVARQLGTETWSVPPSPATSKPRRVR